jgi:mono/diheme cytochrome c family protein
MCHGPTGPGKQFYQADLALDGPELYDLACAACHRDLANSKVEGESANEIREKINENEGGMGPLRVLSTQEIQAIAAALAQPDGDD